MCVCVGGVGRGTQEGGLERGTREESSEEEHPGRELVSVSRRGLIRGFQVSCGLQRHPGLQEWQGVVFGKDPSSLGAGFRGLGSRVSKSHRIRS